MNNPMRLTRTPMIRRAFQPLRNVAPDRSTQSNTKQAYPCARTLSAPLAARPRNVGTSERTR